MQSKSSQSSRLKLSICISTFNRESFIGTTLESILTQANADCEVVVLDAASTDRTAAVVAEYAGRDDRLRYIRQETNNGLDRDYDRVVELARGEYCWLMTDDDLLKPCAVASVLRALRRDELSLVIVNVDSRGASMARSEVLHRSWLDLESDRLYGPTEMDRLFIEVGRVLRYIGCFVIKRATWLARERRRHNGSLWNYLWVIFQKPLPGCTLVIAEPLISYRWGNTHTFSREAFEVVFVNLPSVLGSLPISQSAKGKICSTEPWKDFEELLRFRAMGLYSLTEYRRWFRPRLHSMRESLTPTLVALFPAVLTNTLLVLYYSVTRRLYPRRLYRGVWELEVVLQGMKQSRFYLRNWRVFNRSGTTTN